MQTINFLLFFHLVGAFLFVGGALVAGVLQVAALRRERPSEIALLLRLTRVGVALVGAGALLTIVLGSVLARQIGYDLGATWIAASYALWVASMVLGGAGGRPARHARKLAERLAAEGDRPSPELRALVADRRSLVLSFASGALLVPIIVLMVWRP